MTLDRREEFASLFFSTVILPPSPKNISVACQRLTFVDHFSHLSTGLTITVNNSISVSNDNMARISVYFFAIESSNSNFDRGMRCQSELSVSEVGGTYGCHVGDGDTPVPCVYRASPDSDIDPDFIAFTISSCCVTRGWIQGEKTKMVVEYTTCGEGRKLQRKGISTVIFVMTLTLY